MATFIGALSGALIAARRKHGLPCGAASLQAFRLFAVLVTQSDIRMEAAAFVTIASHEPP